MANLFQKQNTSKKQNLRWLLNQIRVPMKNEQLKVLTQLHSGGKKQTDASKVPLPTFW